MLGLGKWKFTVMTRFYSGEAYLIIDEKGGEYDIHAELANGKRPDFRFEKLRAEGNTITGTARHSLLQGHSIPFSATFEDGAASGFLDVPMVGMIKFSNAEKVG